jgi:hypothetical protein
MNQLDCELLARDAFFARFKKGDIFPSSRGGVTYRVEELSDRGMSVRSTTAARRYMLDFAKLGAVAAQFGLIHPSSIHDGVAQALQNVGLAETSTETILYSASRQYLQMARVPPAMAV